MVKKADKIEPGDFTRSDMIDTRDCAALARREGDSERAKQLSDEYKQMRAHYDRNPGNY